MVAKHRVGVGERRRLATELVEESKARLASAQRLSAAVNLSGLIPTDEETGDHASAVADRLEHEVDILRFVAAVEAQFHASADNALAAAERGLERLEEALALNVGEHVAEPATNEVGPLGDLDVGVIHVGVDEVGPG